VRWFEILELPEGPARTAALAVWVQSFSAGDDSTPVLVGGGAVELYTGGGYRTGDLDFVGEVSSALAEALASAGFERRGRHWVHEKAEVFLEFPGSTLDDSARAVELVVGTSVPKVLSPEDLLVNRLAAWQNWRSDTDGVNAYLIWRQAEEDLDQVRLRELVLEHEVETSFDALARFVDELGGADPSTDQLAAWSRGGGV